MTYSFESDFPGITATTLAKLRLSILCVASMVNLVGVKLLKTNTTDF